ncbi:MAG: YesL family protein [Eubacterium sp.]|nr:YesL family protein [Eubacterium sp.]
MLKRIFHYDNPVFQAINTIGEIIILNFLWMICSLPIVTIGASTTALVYSCIKLHHHDGYPWSNFFHSFKENFKQATVLFLIFLAAGVLLVTDLILGNQANNSFGTFMKIAACVIGIPYFITLLYVFGVQSRFVNSVKDTIRYAFFVALRNYKTTIQLALIVILLVWANTTVALVNYLTIMFGAGFLAYFFAGYYNKVFEQYLPKEETDELESAEAETEE